MSSSRRVFGYDAHGFSKPTKAPEVVMQTTEAVTPSAPVKNAPATIDRRPAFAREATQDSLLAYSLWSSETNDAISTHSSSGSGDEALSRATTTQSSSDASPLNKGKGRVVILQRPFGPVKKTIKPIPKIQIGQAEAGILSAMLF
ncbi:hypothetical protein LTS18_003572 [Coniosporium uncinatum]|uniref:Uncharacterized protein n=1 Tax=Coniosporium uncinatum TaxID=93489 RepID=A0ACC3D6W8_9PEZI|nr:hypothetical protein LTS18_003572 [Coniosporium uncinatum]